MAKQTNFHVGGQDFENLRNSGAVYIDKTDLIYQLATCGAYYCFSRPRRFGRSLLVSTLKAYFEGKKELFKGLAIEKLEQAWVQHPVLHIDFTMGVYSGISTSTEETELEMWLNYMLGEWEEIYGACNDKTDYEGRFADVIRRAHEQSGQRVVVLIDEYDRPEFNAESNKSLYKKNKALLRSFYTVLKAMDAHLEFVLLMGVTKYSHDNMYSGLNNLNDISLDEDYASICGFTEQELRENLAGGVEALAERQELTLEEAYARLKEMYGGYRFSPYTEQEVYNPYSLLRAISSSNLNNYWSDSGTPEFLYKIVTSRPATKQKGCWRMAKSALTERPLRKSRLAPLLYQTGYLTIESSSGGLLPVYTLRFPNREVQESLFYGVLSGMFRSKNSPFDRDNKPPLGEGEIMEFVDTIN